MKPLVAIPYIITERKPSLQAMQAKIVFNHRFNLASFPLARKNLPRNVYEILIILDTDTQCKLCPHCLVKDYKILIYCISSKLRTLFKMFLKFIEK